MAPVKRKSEEKKQEKTKDGKQYKPIRERAKGIAIKEAHSKSETKSDIDNAETKAKKSMKRKREYAVKSKYSLRSGLKGPGKDTAPEIEKTKAEKEKEKVIEIPQDSETNSKEVGKRARNDDDSDDSDGGVKFKYVSVLGLKLDCKKLAEELNANQTRIRVKTI